MHPKGSSKSTGGCHYGESIFILLAKVLKHVSNGPTSELVYCSWKSESKGLWTPRYNTDFHCSGARKRNLKAQSVLTTKLKKHTRRCPGCNKQTEKVFLLFNNTLFLLRGRSGDRWIGKHFHEKEIPAAWKIWTLKDYFRKLFYIIPFQRSHKIQCSVRNIISSIES